MLKNFPYFKIEKWNHTEMGFSKPSEPIKIFGHHLYNKTFVHLQYET